MEEETDWQPEQGDYVMQDSGPLGSNTTVSTYGGSGCKRFKSDEEAEEWIRANMERERYWPNVWRLSDHGNWIGPIKV